MSRPTEMLCEDMPTPDVELHKTTLHYANKIEKEKLIAAGYTPVNPDSPSGLATKTVREIKVG